MSPAEAHEMAARAASKGVRMTFSTAPARKQPKAGDRRATKQHGEQVRVHVRHNGMLVVSGSRYVYDWVSVSDPRAERFSRAAGAAA